MFCYLPEMVKIVNVMECDALSEYLDVLRPIICENCNESTEGFCFKRSEDECPFEMYFSLLKLLHS